MKHLYKGVVAGVVLAMVVATGAWAASKFNKVEPKKFDPAKTFLVQAAWQNGIGCPTNAPVAVYPATKPTTTYTACPTGDTKDKKNAGLLLAKTGPTNNNASAVATLKNVKGINLTELGYDIRKPSSPSDSRGSHCGAGAPRFNVTTSSGTTFIGCNSPAPTVTPEGANNEWLRLRWTVSVANVKSISIVFDEGQDTGPDNFGLAVLDNIDVNGTLVGRNG